MIKILNIQIIEDRIVYTVDIVAVIKNYVFTVVSEIANLEQLIRNDLERAAIENEMRLNDV